MINEVLAGVVNTLHPKRGGGVLESFLVVAIVGFAMYCNIKGIKLSAEMYTLFGIVTGWLVGKNGNKGSEKNE